MNSNGKEENYPFYVCSWSISYTFGTPHILVVFHKLVLSKRNKDNESCYQPKPKPNGNNHQIGIKTHSGIYITPNQSSNPNPKPLKTTKTTWITKTWHPLQIYITWECTHAWYKYITHRFQEINGMINKEILSFWFTLCDAAFEVITWS